MKESVRHPYNDLLEKDLEEKPQNENVALRESSQSVIKALDAFRIDSIKAARNRNLPTFRFLKHDSSQTTTLESEFPVSQWTERDQYYTYEKTHDLKNDEIRYVITQLQEDTSLGGKARIAFSHRPESYDQKSGKRYDPYSLDIGREGYAPLLKVTYDEEGIIKSLKGRMNTKDDAYQTTPTTHHTRDIHQLDGEYIAVWFGAKGKFYEYNGKYYPLGHPHSFMNLISNKKFLHISMNRDTATERPDIDASVPLKLNTKKTQKALEDDDIFSYRNVMEELKMYLVSRREGVYLNTGKR